MAEKRYKRDSQVLEQRRKTAAKRLVRGMKQAQVARELHVNRQSVFVWAKTQAIDNEGWRRKLLGGVSEFKSCAVTVVVQTFRTRHACERFFLRHLDTASERAADQSGVRHRVWKEKYLVAAQTNGIFLSMPGETCQPA